MRPSGFRIPVSLVVLFCAAALPAGAVSVVDGEATCDGIASQSYRMPALDTGQYWLDAGNSLWFQFYPDTNRIFFFTNSTIRIQGVLAYGGGKTMVWTMPDGGATGWPSLQAPHDPSTEEPAPLDAVTFCYDYNLYLDPNAYARTRRSWSWTIEKTGYAGSLTLTSGQVYDASYSITVTPTPVIEPGLAVDGPVYVTNPTPYSTTLESVAVSLQQMADTDGNGTLDVLAASVSCPSAPPYALAPFTQLECEFSAALPDGGDRLVIADVVHDGIQGVARSIEQLNFSGEVETNECVAIDDNLLADDLYACASAGARTFTYTAPIGPFAACGSFEVANTASVIGRDDATTFGSSTWTVSGQVPCADGCTRGAGYWKGHPAEWTLAGGPSTPFFSSGASFQQVLGTPSRGNAYYILAHAYIAATLNQSAGASLGAAAAALDAATAIFQSTTPAQTASLGGKDVLRRQMIALAATLDDFNSGVVGPGACP